MTTTDVHYLALEVVELVGEIDLGTFDCPDDELAKVKDLIGEARDRLRTVREEA